jgi:hypothetical protein
MCAKLHLYASVDAASSACIIASFASRCHHSELQSATFTIHLRLYDHYAQHVSYLWNRRCDGRPGCGRLVYVRREGAQAIANDAQTCSSTTKEKLSTYACAMTSLTRAQLNIHFSGRSLPRKRITIHICQLRHRAMHWSLRRRIGMVRLAHKNTYSDRV